jgi:hypothetical protein
VTKFPKKDTRIRTPSGRFAIIESYDADDRVHVKYYDDDGGTGCFPAKLIRDSDIIAKPDAGMYAERASGVRRREDIEEAPERRFYLEQFGQLIKYR